MAKIRVPSGIAGFVISSIMKLLALSWRWRVVDRSGMTDPATASPRPVIWLVWHNRILMAVPLQWRRLRHRHGSVLTSASRDGDVLASVCRHFGINAVRGSSSKRKIAALLELKGVIDAGGDVCITPDGPRGPCYSLQGGVVLLAQKTGARIMPIHLQPRSLWRLDTWDGFMIPKPFSRIDVLLDPLIELPHTDSAEAFEKVRSDLERRLMTGTGEAAPPPRRRTAKPSSG